MTEYILIINRKYTLHDSFEKVELMRRIFQLDDIKSNIFEKTEKRMSELKERKFEEIKTREKSRIFWKIYDKFQKNKEKRFEFYNTFGYYWCYDYYGKGEFEKQTTEIISKCNECGKTEREIKIDLW